jgi:hypothetical protein
LSNKEGIAKHLLNDIELIEKIQKLMVKVEIISDNKKDMLLGAFSRNVISHFVSINILIDKRLLNSAFALIRIFFENVIKLKYMYYKMDDKKIETIYNANTWNNHFPKTIDEMVKEIDSFLDTKYYSNIKNNAYKMMNDYTHTGRNQIMRNFSETGFTFDNELILETLKSNKVLFKSAIVVFLESIGLKNGFLSKDEMDNFLKY